MPEDILHKIAITLLPGVGPKTAKKLIAYCGGAEAVFKEKTGALKKIPGNVPEFSSVDKAAALERAAEELNFMTKRNIHGMFFLDKEYPVKLANCEDSPIILYYKGNTDLNNKRIVSIVGTRKATDYGKDFCARFIQEISEMDILVASGLAYGIDIAAHKASLANNVPTIGVLGHGLDRIYPGSHVSVAEKMIENGGLLTEFLSGTNPDRENFPARNRIIAGMADATVVVEAGKSGGALITAELANSYNRDVFAVPGRVGDPYSEGCNYLIKNNKAALIESAADFISLMCWEEKPKQAVQKQLFVELTQEEEVLVDLLKRHGVMEIDNLCIMANMSSGKTAAHLLNLEFNGLVKALPGKRFQLN
jgi:DNA processing protein